MSGKHVFEMLEQHKKYGASYDLNTLSPFLMIGSNT